MKNIFLLLLILLIFGQQRLLAQFPNCNSLTQISLGPTCTHTLTPEEILEGTILSNCIVEIDKVAPFGNGPWVAPVLGIADIDKTYQVRVRHTPSGNSCWGSVMAEDKLPPQLECGGVTMIDLSAGTPVTMTGAEFNIDIIENCGGVIFTPNIFQFDCSTMGLNIVQLNGTDASDNLDVCQHAVVVSGSAVCQPCVSHCPPPVSVSYEEGNITLLNAFQNNAWDAFDVFGNALFDTGCSYTDSSYSINHQTGISGQNWFERSWQWNTNSGPVTCEQFIMFPTKHTVNVAGKVYLDANENCSYDAGEQGVHAFQLQATIFPSGFTQTIYPDAAGNYSADIEFGVNDNGAQLHLVLPSGVNPVCASALYIPNSSANPSHQFDIGLQTGGSCPQMQVDLGNLFTRRCATNYFKINYCNNGLDTAYGAFITLNLDSLIQLQSASLPYTVAGADSLYTFQLGDVAPFYCGEILVQAMVSCDATLGQTLCNEVFVFPDTSCTGSWQGAELIADAECAGDSVSLTLRNIGPQDMQAPVGYIVVEDFIMYKQGDLQLPAGGSFTIKTPASGATWHIEAPQAPGFPNPEFVLAAVEGCGGINTFGVINAFGPGASSQTHDTYCSQVVASCDPNDKTAIPTGYTDDHIIRANQTIEYKIRFQNTGTDTAFRVVIMDTLSTLLDARTLKVGASSHPYQLRIFDGGILQFEFLPIALPDSNVNEPASHGYVQFSIAQQPDLPDGTLIENTVAIYFDENDPVFTNTAFHTIGSPLIQNPELVYSTEMITPACYNSADGAIYVSVTGGVPPYTFEWSDPALQGDSLSGLVGGVYHLTFKDSYRGEFSQSFELNAPDSINIVMGSSPTLDDENNGLATVAASGGSGELTILWNTGSTNSIIQDLPAGVYSVVISDANGCSNSSEITVAQEYSQPQLTFVQSNPSCFAYTNGSIFVTVTGAVEPYAFEWSNPQLQGDSLTGLPAGQYDLTITAANGGQLTQTFILISPAQIILHTTGFLATGSQSNGVASAVATGGVGPFTHLWDTGATTQNVTGLPTGIYAVTVTDSNGCTAWATVLVPQTSSIDEPGEMSRIKLWPNPAHDRITLDLQQVLPQVLRLDMFGADGRLLQQFYRDELQALTTLDVARERNSGFILLVLHTQNGHVITEKVIIR